MKINLRASEIAAMIGRNIFKSPQQILSELTERYKQKCYYAQKKNKKLQNSTYPQKFNREIQMKQDASDVLDINSEIRDYCKKKNKYEINVMESKNEELLYKSMPRLDIQQLANKMNKQTSTGVQTSINNIRNCLSHNKQLTDSEGLETLNQYQTKWKLSYGIQSEESTCKIIEENESVILQQDQHLYEKEILTLGNNNYVIVGQVDRIEHCSDGSKRLLEVKNRVKRLSQEIPEYELIQIQVYLELLGFDQARLVEQYDNELSSHIITRDQQFWNTEILPRVQLFCKELHNKII